MYNEKINATIQLDKLVLCCNSTVEDNFNHAIKYYADEAIQQSHSFGKTVLTQTVDNKRRFRFCYTVSHAGCYIGKISFCMFGQPHRDDQVWFSLSNQVFYNGLIQYLPNILLDLNLEINNITRLEIALDCYDYNFEQILRRNIRNKDNKVKLLNKYIDRTARTPQIKYWNYGSPNNPFQVRTVYIQNQRLINYSNHKGEEEQEDDSRSKKTEVKKTTFELAAYNKLEEIKDFSPHKIYILNYHKAHNPKFKNIYRLEIRLESEELRRYIKKHKKPIELSNLLDKTFLFNMFTEYIDRIIVIKDSNKQKINLYPTPFLSSLEGKLPLTLPETNYEPQPIKNKKLIKEEIKEKEYYEDMFINNPFYNTSYTITNYEYNYEKEKAIRRNQEKNQPSHDRLQKSELWQTPIPES